ncbi:MAG: UDP-3-O-(3-hydroxymyristoyl)glucosamine N-acyltransferase [Rhabdaerophilum sp.]
MSNPSFFPLPAGLSLTAIAEATGAKLVGAISPDMAVSNVAPLEAAGPGDLTFLENTAYTKYVAGTGASACFIVERQASLLPAHCAALVSNEPYRAFAKAAGLLFPSAARPQSIFGMGGIAPGAFVHPDAKLESGVNVDPGAVIGPGAEIGRGTIICAQAVIGPGVRIGRDSAIGPGASITHALIGNRVIVHPGARIGQDGFGFAMSPRGHLKVPQVGRVIIQDDVEIGANTTIDRGANRDTVIGEGTKIDNLVQIGHNVQIGRHCVIVGLVGISGSTVLEDFVVIGGQAGVAGHLRIGMGAQVGAQSGVMNDLPAGGKYLGAPAKPARQTFREVAALAKLAQKGDQRG